MNYHVIWIMFASFFIAVIFKLPIEIAEAVSKRKFVIPRGVTCYWSLGRKLFSALPLY